jgi:DNA-binding CsgD family transcriptional regulator
MLALYFKRELAVIDAVLQATAEYHLTDREQETLIGVTMGLTSKEVAQRMDISPNTVKAFLRLIMIKMGVLTRAGIVGRLLDQNALGEQDRRVTSKTRSARTNPSE